MQQQALEAQRCELEMRRSRLEELERALRLRLQGARSRVAPRRSKGPQNLP